MDWWPSPVTVPAARSRNHTSTVVRGRRTGTSDVRGVGPMSGYQESSPVSGPFSLRPGLRLGRVRDESGARVRSHGRGRVRKYSVDPGDEGVQY